MNAGGGRPSAYSNVRWAGGGRRSGIQVLAALLVSGAGCSKSPTGVPAGPPPAPPAVPVTVAPATRENVPVQLRAVARVEAYQTVTVKPQLTGQIREVHFQRGQIVAEGDLLFALDARPFEAALRKAEGLLEKDLALARDADAEAAWQKDLFQKNVATEREFDKSAAAAAALHATVAADRAVVDQARLDVEYCQIRAPLAGVTGDVLADRGNVVKANEAQLVVINRVEPIYVALAIPEQYLAEVRRHQAAAPLIVEATIPAESAASERGELTFIDNQVDRTTGTIMLKGTFANAERRLWPGQYVNAVLRVTELSDAVVVPTAAVQTGLSGTYVFVVEDDHAVALRPVATGLSIDHRTVISQGVDAGERVVTEGHMRLVPGSRVEIKGEAVAPTPRGSVP